jgi:fluoride exporter
MSKMSGATMLRSVLLVGAGGFIGSVFRYLVQITAARIFPVSFPVGTFLVNILGCFIIGVVIALGDKGNILTSDLRLFLAVGLCGGFTTFSAFSADNLLLLKDGTMGLLLLNVFASVLLGLLAVYGGIIIIRSLL